MPREKAIKELRENAECFLNQFWKQQPTNQQLYGHLPPIAQTMQIRQATHAGHCCRKKRTNSWLMFSKWHLHMSIPVLAMHQKLIFISSARILDALQWSYQERWLERVKAIWTVGLPYWWWWKLKTWHLFFYNTQLEF